jgi:hypothetical protein
MRAAQITGPGRAARSLNRSAPHFQVSASNKATVLESCRLQWTLSSGGARWWLLRLATQAPGQVAGHNVGDHGKQHQEYGDPKNPTVVHSLPARAIGMITVALMIVFCLIHRFLA